MIHHSSNPAQKPHPNGAQPKLNQIQLRLDNFLSDIPVQKPPFVPIDVTRPPPQPIAAKRRGRPPGSKTQKKVKPNPEVRFADQQISDVVFEEDKRSTKCRR